MPVTANSRSRNGEADETTRRDPSASARARTASKTATPLVSMNPTPVRSTRIRRGGDRRSSVIARVVAEAADLRQPEAVAVEGHDVRQALGVAGDAQLHRSGPRAGERDGESGAQ